MRGCGHQARGTALGVIALGLPAIADQLSCRCTLSCIAAGGKVGHTQEYLKQIVFGGNDGIVTTFAIVAGFAGAQAEGVGQIGAIAVLVFGLANLMADAVSMGLGEFLSGRSQRDLYRHQCDALRRNVLADPEAAQGHLGRLLHERGLDAEDARKASSLLARKPGLLSDILLHYDEDLRPPDGNNPALNGLMTFLAFVAFGIIPLFPYFVMAATDRALAFSVAATLIALVLLGALRWSATAEGGLRAIGETVLVGSVCAVVAFLVGMLVGGGG